MLNYFLMLKAAGLMLRQAAEAAAMLRAAACRRVMTAVLMPMAAMRQGRPRRRVHIASVVARLGSGVAPNLYTNFDCF